MSKELKLKDLTPRELEYFQMMNGQYLVPMLKGKPGTAKSALLRSIADKLDMVFIDLRLPTMDEIDLGVYPVVNKVTVDGVDHHELKHAIPEWAMMTANTKKNFLIVFEELNRASKAVRDAALGVLLERRVGHNFVFADNVWMAATGNVGTDDGTDVEEFDMALKSRLITIHHDMDFADWKRSYADANIHKDIVAYLGEYPNAYYPPLKEQGSKDGSADNICNPRTWTALSKAIERNFGKTATVEEYENFVIKCGRNYVGAQIIKFLQYVNEHRTVTLREVLDGKPDFAKINRDNKAEIVKNAVAIVATEEFTKLKASEIKNLIAFARTLDRDQLTGMVYSVGEETMVRTGDGDLHKNDATWAKEFDTELEYVNKQYNEDTKKASAPKNK